MKCALEIGAADSFMAETSIRTAPSTSNIPNQYLINMINQNNQRGDPL